MIALAYGLTNGTSALAAPPGAGSKPTDNPFETAATTTSDKGDTRRRRRATAATAGDAADDAASATSNAESRGRGRQRRRRRRRASRPSRRCTGSPAWRGTRPAAGARGSSAATSSRSTASSCRGWAASTPPTRCRRPTATAARVAFYPSEDFGLELLVTRTPMQFRLEEPFTAFDQQTHFTPSVAWQGIASLLWSPIHAKFKFSDTTIIHGDLFAVAGAGRTADRQRAGTDLGGGRRRQALLQPVLRLPARPARLPACRRRCWGAAASPTTSRSWRGSAYGSARTRRSRRRAARGRPSAPRAPTTRRCQRRPKAPRRRGPAPAPAAPTARPAATPASTRTSRRICSPSESSAPAASVCSSRPTATS